MTPATPIPFVSRHDKTLQEEWLHHLQQAMPDLEVTAFSDRPVSYWQDATIAIVADPDPDVLNRLPGLRWVQSLWAGVEQLIEDLSSEIAIVRMTDPQLSLTMAEAVLAWTLYLHRDMPVYARQQRNRIWQSHNVPLASERTVAILGLGELGQAAATALKRENFDVTGWSRSLKTIDGLRTFAGNDGLDKVLNEADIVVILLPQTPETCGLIDCERLARMKRGASLINFARGPIIDTEALLTSLHNSHLNHAVLDVFECEPLPVDDRLWSEPEITILPHISAPTNRTTASRIAAQNIMGFIDSGQIPVAVNRSRGY